MELLTVRTLKEKIEVAKLKLLALRENAQSITSKVEKFAAQIVDAENELSRLVIEFAERSEELTTLIKQRVKGNAAIVLYRRYILCETFKEIATAMDYSEHICTGKASGVSPKFEIKNP